MAKKNRMRMILIGFGLVVLIGAVGIGGYFMVQYFRTQSTVTTLTSDSYELDFVDYYTGEDEDVDPVTIAWYSYDVSEVEDEDYVDTVEALSFSDFTSRGSHTDWEIETDEDELEIVFVKLSKSGFETRFFTDEPLLADGKMDVLVPGENVIRMLNTTEDVSMAAYSIQGTTINQTNDREWSITTYCLDAAEGTGDKTHKEGVMPFYDMENGYANSFALRIEFNTTADLGWCTYNGNQETTEAASGNYIYYLFDSDVFTDETELKVKLGSTLGTSFECIGMSVGRYTSSYSAWDSQN